MCNTRGRWGGGALYETVNEKFLPIEPMHNLLSVKPYIMVKVKVMVKNWGFTLPVRSPGASYTLLRKFSPLESNSPIGSGGYSILSPRRGGGGPIANRMGFESAQPLSMLKCSTSFAFWPFCLLIKDKVKPLLLPTGGNMYSQSIN